MKSSEISVEYPEAMTDASVLGAKFTEIRDVDVYRRDAVCTCHLRLCNETDVRVVAR